jgi:lipase chaperone LimK
MANNADTKVFQVINIAGNTKLSAEEKQKQVNAILGDDPDARRIFNEKYQNIRKLEQNGKL